MVDTNLLIYAADSDSPEHAKCRELLLGWRIQTSPWYVTWGIMYEFLRVTTHRNVFRKPFTLSQAWSFLETVLASPSLDILAETERHATVAAEILDQVPSISGDLLFDVHTAVLMREHGLKTIYTHDADFNRFPFLEVIDPL